MAQPDAGQSLQAPAAANERVTSAEGFSVPNLGTLSSASNRAVSPPEPVASDDVNEIWAKREAPEASAEEKRPALRLSAEMFKRKARETHGFTEEPSAEHKQQMDDLEHTVLATNTYDSTDSLATGSRPSRLAVKKLNTEKRFNPMPILSTIAAIAVTGGAMYMAREYTKSLAPRPAPATGTISSVDLSGGEYKSADDKRMLRFVTRSSLELVDREKTNLANYHIRGEAVPPPMGGLFGAPQKMVITENANGFSFPDGSAVYKENSDNLKIVDKMRGISNFANYYFAKHDKLYPGAEQDFDKRFGWNNPITGDVNKPVIAKQVITKDDFDSAFITTLNDMRNLKPRFAADDATTSPPGLIECITLSPANAATASDTGSGVIIRAYDSEGKLMRSCDPEKAFVIALKNGVSVDPIKATRTVDNQAPLFDPGKNYEVELVMLKKPETAKDKAK